MGAPHAHEGPALMKVSRRARILLVVHHLRVGDVRHIDANELSADGASPSDASGVTDGASNDEMEPSFFRVGRGVDVHLHICMKQRNGK